MVEIENNEGSMNMSLKNPLLRSESLGFVHYNHEGNYYSMNMEKRQLFLRSYQFSRKKSMTEKIKGCVVRVKKLVWLKLRSARTLKRILCSRIKCSFYYRRRRFFRLLRKTHSASSCFS